jgi:hypothetical protein
MRVGSWFRRAAARSLTLALLALASRSPLAAAGADGPPPLVIEASPSYRSEIEHLETIAPERMRSVMALVGLRDGGPTIHVVLAAEDHPLARGVPPPIAGYAIPAEDLAVLLPERVPSYPYDSLDEVLLHELTHVLASRAAGGRELPRWWNEGLALLASRGWSLEDRSRVLLGAVSGVADTPALEAAFDRGSQQSAAAYAISGALVHHLVQRHGVELVARTLAGVAAGNDFAAAFESAAGVSLARAVEAFWKRYLFWYRWLPFLTSGAALWASVTALAILAGLRRRRRDAEIRRRWAAEEGLEDLANEVRETIH